MNGRGGDREWGGLKAGARPEWEMGQENKWRKEEEQGEQKTPAVTSSPVLGEAKES